MAKAKHAGRPEPMTADEVAALYGVHKATVYRWVKLKAFKRPPLMIPSPSGERDRLLFDRNATLRQHKEETEAK